MRAENVRQHLERCVLLVGSGRDVVGHADGAHITHAAKGDEALAVLRGFFCPCVVELAGRTGNGAKMLRDQRETFGFVKFAGDDQHDVVRLIKLFVERLQIFDRHALDIAAVADGGLAVIVPFVSSGLDALVENTLGGIFAALEFIAHHGHFRIKVGLPDETVHQPVGFERNGEFQVFVRGGKGLEIVHAVHRGAPIKLRAVILQGLGHVGIPGRAFEDHMLEQVRHAGLSVTFVARTDQHGEVDGDLRLGVVREEQRAKTVVELVFGDALHGGHLARRGRFSSHQVASNEGSGRERKRDGPTGRRREAV